MSKEGNIVLIGNPNVGKSVVFNMLTGARQRVSNFPGTTVEKKEGSFNYGDRKYKLTDLPGIYSLAAYSLDEKVSRAAILETKPDLIIDVLDSSVIERNLFLLYQLIELGIPIIAVFNKEDVAKKNGIILDFEGISKFLGIPCIPMVAPKGKGKKELLEAINNYKSGSMKDRFRYDLDSLSAIEEMARILQKHSSDDEIEQVKWLSLKVLEKDTVIVEGFQESMDEVAFKQLETEREEILQKFNIIDPEFYFAQMRYNVIALIKNRYVKKDKSKKWSSTDMMDEVFTHKWLGIPIFLMLMWGVFQITFIVGDPFIGLIEMIFSAMGNIVVEILGDNILSALIADGIIAGVGSILVFLPNIVILFIVISILEDSGYMARAAFIMDKIMRKLGLHGQSFIHMMLGFGCSVPAVMGTRTLKGEDDRLITILVVPLIACGARLPVYVLFASILVPGSEAEVVLFLYILGIVLAVIMAMIFRNTLFKGQVSPFIMEMPEYSMPQLRTTGLKVWERSYAFVRRAGTIILLTVVFIWGMDYFGLLQPIGEVLSIAFLPFGWGWELVIALVFGFLAKEVVVGTLGIVTGIGETGEDDPNLITKISTLATPEQLFAYLLFVATYLPCVAVLGAIKQESKSWKWVIVTVIYTTILAYIVALIAYGAAIVLFPVLGIK